MYIHVTSLNYSVSVFEAVNVLEIKASQSCFYNCLSSQRSDTQNRHLQAVIVLYGMVHLYKWSVSSYTNSTVSTAKILGFETTNLIFLFLILL